MAHLRSSGGLAQLQNRAPIARVLVADPAYNRDMGDVLARVEIGAQVVAGDAGFPFCGEYIFGREQLVLFQPIGDILLLRAGPPAERRLGACSLNGQAECAECSDSVFLGHGLKLQTPTKIYKQFVTADGRKSTYAASMASNVDFAAEWLRSERERFGWSTTELAKRARQLAADDGDQIKLTQQSISHFENRRAKSVPRWLRYVRMAMELEVANQRMPPGRVYQLTLKGDGEPTGNDLIDWRADGPDLSQEEEVLLGKWRQLAPDDKSALFQVLDRMIVPRTVHAPMRAYRASDSEASS